MKERDIIVTWKKDNVVENWGFMVGLKATNIAEAWDIVRDLVEDVNLIKNVKLGK